MSNSESNASEASVEAVLTQAQKFGIKRICQACTAKYYDLNQNPILCPSCGVEFDPEATLSRRRSRLADEDKPSAEAKPAESEEEIVADLPDVELEDDEGFDKSAVDATLLEDDDDGPILPEVVVPSDEQEDDQ